MQHFHTHLSKISFLHIVFLSFVIVMIAVTFISMQSVNKSRDTLSTYAAEFAMPQPPSVVENVPKIQSSVLCRCTNGTIQSSTCSAGKIARCVGLSGCACFGSAAQ